MLKSKAQEFAECLEIRNFDASNLWLERLWKGHISFKCISGKPVSVNTWNYYWMDEKISILNASLYT